MKQSITAYEFYSELMTHAGKWASILHYKPTSHDDCQDAVQRCMLAYACKCSPDLGPEPYTPDQLDGAKAFIYKSLRFDRLNQRRNDSGPNNKVSALGDVDGDQRVSQFDDDNSERLKDAHTAVREVLEEYIATGDVSPGIVEAIELRWRENRTFEECASKAGVGTMVLFRRWRKFLEAVRSRLEKNGFPVEDYDIRPTKYEPQDPEPNPKAQKGAEAESDANEP